MNKMLLRHHVLSDLNDGQAAAAGSFGTAQMVVAGAGTGKSRTLKARVAAALLPAEPGTAPVCGGVGRLLVTTFTEAAAAELKDDIKAKLEECAALTEDEGQRAFLKTEARRVDDAWIGTIHSICSRVIRENALVFGVDPAFETLDDAGRASLMCLAGERAVDQARASVGYAALFEYYDGADKPLKLAEALIGKAAGLPGGLDDVVPGVFKTPNPLVTTQLVAFAKLLSREFQALKGFPCLEEENSPTAPAMLDFDDLLLVAERGLREHPEVAARCRSQIDLIMVDEFQDTNEVQASFIGHIAAPGLANVCCVGDRNQSIYRFRGADPSVTDRVCERMGIAPQGVTALDENYRSHGDILAFVEAVFSQEEAFGERFLKLRASGKVAAEPDPVFDGAEGLARCSVYICQAVKAAEARARAAEEVAGWFEELERRQPAAAGRPTRALLLGSMTYAGQYVDALERRGFSCLVTSGSGFNGAYEVRVVAALTALLSRGFDDKSLYTALHSGLFCVGDAALATLRQAGHCPVAGLELCAGFANEQAWSGFSDTDRKKLALAQSILYHGAQIALADGLAEAVRFAVRESGWMERLGAEGSRGIEQAANIHQALRMLETLDTAGMGPAQASERFGGLLQNGKQTVGTLTQVGIDHIVVMTVHGSKGLEFDYVAVAEMGNGAKAHPSESAAPAAEVVRLAEETGAPNPCLLVGVRPEKGKAVPAGAPDEAAFPELTMVDGDGKTLEDTVSEQRLQEAGRLMYVALTRAKRAVMYARCTGKAGKEAAGVDLWIEHALGIQPGGALEGTCEYGGSAPAFVRVSVGEDAPAAPAARPRSRSAMPSVEALELAMAAPRPVPIKAHPRAGVYSYSSISAALHKDDDLAQPAVAPEQAAPSATHLGTAFHHVCQRAIEDVRLGLAQELRPDPCVVEREANALQLTADQRDRLAAALTKWFASDELRSFSAAGDLQAEVPFFVALDREAGVFLEGEIDALAIEGSTACLVDYKTGGHDAETPEELYEKHLLQAQCYAYALMTEGYQSVGATFVRVERTAPAAPAQPQCVRYAFGASELDSLRARILSLIAQGKEERTSL